MADFTGILCRSWQNLHFKSCPIRYIKLVGTHNTANTDFHAVELEAYYTKDEPNLVNGFISPTVNVATTEKGAKVIEGLTNAGDTLDVLLNGDFKNYSGGAGYTYHLIGDSLSMKKSYINHTLCFVNRARLRRHSAGAAILCWFMPFIALGSRRQDVQFLCGNISKSKRLENGCG